MKLASLTPGKPQPHSSSPEMLLGALFAPARRSGLGLATFVLVVAGCGATPPHRRAEPAPKSAAACPKPFDAATFLRAHAKAFGTEAGYLASLPRTLRGETELNRRTSTFEQVVDRTRLRTTSPIGPVFLATGVDETGPWSSGVDGVLVREKASADDNTAAWVAERRYVSAFDPLVDKASCEIVEGRPAVTLRFARESVPAVALQFDGTTTALVRIDFQPEIAGKGHLRFIESWSDPDARGMRWPVVFADVQGPTRRTVRIREALSGARCSAPPSEDCLAPLPPLLRFPANGERVALPLSMVAQLPLVRTRVAGAERWAMLDSGARLSLVDPASPLGKDFRGEISVDGMGARGRAAGTLGVVDDVHLGDLAFSKLAAVAVPARVLEQLGERRPELLFGFPLFASAAVRLDYRRGELIVARDASAVRSPTARRIALAADTRSGRAVVEAEVEGVVGRFLVDTGSNASLVLDARWAKSHGLPGAREQVKTQGLFGAGEESREHTEFVVKGIAFGETRFGDVLVRADEPVDNDDLAGSIGQGLLTRCSAAVFDVPGRAIWLEPPCDRPSQRRRVAWSFLRSPNDKYPDAPWVIASVAPGSAAAKAGLAAGDRIVEVNGAPARDPVTIDERLMPPTVTRASLVVIRQGAVKRVSFELGGRDTH